LRSVGHVHISCLFLAIILILHQELITYNRITLCQNSSRGPAMVVWAADVRGRGKCPAATDGSERV